MWRPSGGIIERRSTPFGLPCRRLGTWPEPAKQRAGGDDALNPSNLRTTDDREQPAALPQPLQYDIDRVIRMRMNEAIVHDVTERFTATACAEQLLELLTRDGACKPLGRAHEKGTCVVL